MGIKFPFLPDEQEEEKQESFEVRPELLEMLNTMKSEEEKFEWMKEIVEFLHQHDLRTISDLSDKEIIELVKLEILSHIADNIENITDIINFTIEVYLKYKISLNRQGRLEVQKTLATIREETQQMMNPLQGLMPQPVEEKTVAEVLIEALRGSGGERGVML